jgi:hypothetical protein
VDTDITRTVARIAWVLPLFFLGLALHQSKVAYDLHYTLENGELATAEVLEIHKENRVDVTYDYASLRIPLENGETITRNRLSLPHSLVPVLEGRETLDVRVLPGASQEVVIEAVVHTQWRIAALNAVMGAGAALLFGFGIWFWNRYLRREGDPAERGVLEGDPDHPARQIVRGEG